MAIVRVPREIDIFFRRIFSNLPQSFAQTLIVLVCHLIVWGDASFAFAQMRNCPALQASFWVLYKGFSSRCNWAISTLKARALQHLALAVCKSVATREELLYLAIDDVFLKKNKSAKSICSAAYHYNHSEGKAQWGQVIVTSVLIIAGCVLAFHNQLYLRQDKARKHKIKFRSKVEIAVEIIRKKLPLNAKKVFVLFDSWYAVSAVVEAVREMGYQAIGEIRCNRNFFPGKDLNAKVMLREYAKTLSRKDFRKATINDLTYYLHECYGIISTLGEGKLVVVRDTSRKNQFRFIVCTDTTLDAKAILEHYLQRWNIEVTHWYLKQRLNMASCKLRSIKAFKRYVGICWLTYNFLEYFRIKNDYESIADVILYLKSRCDRETIKHIRRSAFTNQTLDSICKQLNVAA